MTEAELDWAIEWEGTTYRRSDMTVRHAQIVAELMGEDSWEWLALPDVHPARGPLTTAAVLVACLCVEEDVTDRVGALAVFFRVLRNARLDALHQAVRVG